MLVKRDQVEVLNALKGLEGQPVPDAQIDAWAEQGLAFRSSPEGVRAMHLAEVKVRRATAATVRKPSSLRYSAADLYVQVGSDKQPLYVKASKAAAALEDVAAGTLTAQQLERKGDAFTNVTELFIAERVLSRADDIATRIKDFPLMSSQWKTWINKSESYNATSLQQVMVSYFQEQSIGDVGGRDAKYVPKRGYPGTLAPGENFKEDNPIDELPKRILHPWPAMQQMQFHVRWPPAHPMLPPPLLFFGLNNMYTDNFTNWQMSLPSTEVVGGLYMEPKDAMRIAKTSKIGMCYDPKDQLEHGGLIFPGRHIIPNYNPDHGPTIPEEQSKPPIPRELLPFAERWVDPFFDLEQLQMKEPIADAALAAEAAVEEEERRLAAERMLAEVIKPAWIPKEEEEAAEMKREAEARLNTWMQSQTKKWAELEEEYGLSAGGEDDTEVLRRAQLVADEKRKIEADMVKEKDVREVATGQARSTRALITYTIDVIRDMNAEISRAEQDMATRRKSGRRRQRKGRPAAVAALPLGDEPGGEGEPTIA